MANYHVEYGITGIYAGTLNKSNTMWRNKNNVTDEAIRAVAQYLLEHEECLNFDYHDKHYRLVVEPLGSDEQRMTRVEAICKVIGYLTACLPVDEFEKVEEIINALEQDSRTGRWVEEKIYPPLSDAQITIYRCSYCDFHFDCVSNYCPNCGAKMESEE